MEAFPFTKLEWDAVKVAVLPVVNSGLADEPEQHASYLIVLLNVLADLRTRYGNHPVLLETQADFIRDAQERIDLY